MSTAGYLQDAKNQQKRLAEIITAKGITATATEKYKDLVDKAAQIENLKGEERTLENFTNVLSEPKSIVQLEYPDNTPKTLNAKLGSKNLISYPYTDTTKTLNGITFTVNSDGSVALSGASTGQATFYFMYGSLSLKKGTTYTFSASGDYNFSGSATLYIYDSKQGQTAYIPLATDKKATFTPNVDIKNTNCYIVVPANRTASGTIKVQLELGSTATTYEPYQGQTYTPVNVTRCGKNLIPYPYYNTTKTENGVTFTVNTDGSIALSGASTGQATFYFMYGSLSLKKGTTYTFSASGDYNFSGSATLYIYDSKQGQTAYIPLATDKKATFTPNVDIKNTNCYIVVPANRTASGTIKVQLELGSTATTYEPYQGQTYTPTVSGEVTGITNLYPTTTLLTDNSGVVFEQITGGFYKEILPSTDKNGITKVYQPSVDSTIDSNIKPENIKKGVKILGILGTYDGN